MFEQLQLWIITFGRPALELEGLPNNSEGAEVTALETLLNSVYLIAGIAAVIAIIMGGFWYVTSNGEADKIKRGKNAIIYASIGIVVILLAFGITGFVSDRIVG